MRRSWVNGPEEWLGEALQAPFHKFLRNPAHACLRKPGQIVEAAGIAPASREALARASTCVADRLIVGLGAPVGRVSFGLSRHEFSPNRNKRLGSGDPELASPAGSLGRRPGARPSLFFRQRDGDQHGCWQLSFGRLFTRPADQPRHATVHLGHPVDPGSPPNGRRGNVTPTLYGTSHRLARSVLENLASPFFNASAWPGPCRVWHLAS